jgi:hypothetical protein
MITIVESHTKHETLANVYQKRDCLKPFDLPFCRTLPNGLTVKIDSRKKVTISNIWTPQRDQALIYNLITGKTKEVIDTPLYKLKRFLDFPNEVNFSLKGQKIATITSRRYDNDLKLTIINVQTTLPSRQKPGI